MSPRTGRINILPENLINQIAAGEVIERPASVVKELIENAVDAEAGHITVELEEAGKKLIRVADDGRGMPPDDVPLALASHATSKVTTAEDLEGIATLGFRGEALASIASVADVTITSRTLNAIEAVEVESQGGKVGEPKPAGAPPGTTVEVKNLFRYVPARRKFLKTDRTEMGHITEAVTRLALAYPAVHFTVRHNGREVYELPPADDLRTRVAAFFGQELAEEMAAVESEEKAGRIFGLVAPPHLSRATSSGQYLFINGRYVRDRSLLHALREAYRGMLEGGRQPVAILFFEVPPERVDANVHPTKVEVRLRDAHLLYGQVLAAVREKLLGPGMTPHMQLPGGADPHAVAETDEADDERRRRVERAVADFLRSPQAAAQGGFRYRGRSDRPAETGDGLRPSIEHLGKQAAELGGREAASPPQRPAEETEPEPPVNAIQLHNTYLVAATADGIVIVDQHALHERILFEETMDGVAEGALESQRLLVPVTVELTDAELAAVEEHADALARLGMEVEPLGPRTAGIHAFPMRLAGADPEGTLRDFLAWVLAREAPPSAAQVLEKLVHVAACRAAVKAGDRLAPEEIQQLLAHREAARLATTCPHGRPTALVLDRKQLEKQFGRDYAAGPATGDAGDEALPF